VGKAGSKWHHDWTPANAQAALLKAHGSLTGAKRIMNGREHVGMVTSVRKPGGRTSGTLPRDLLRVASDRQLTQHYSRHESNGNVRRQLEAEMNRRDTVDARRKAAAQRAFTRRTDAAAEIERRSQAAEAATKGYMVNDRGRAAGVSTRRLLTNSRDAERYASPEMRAYLESEGRGTRTLSASGAYKVARRAEGRRAVAARTAAAQRAGTQRRSA
jgi:hypothetical protein